MEGTSADVRYPQTSLGAHRSCHIRGDGQAIRFQREEQRDGDGAIFANVFPEDPLEQVASRLPRLWGQETGLPGNPLGARLVFELEREDVVVTAVRFNGVGG